MDRSAAVFPLASLLSCGGGGFGMIKSTVFVTGGGWGAVGSIGLKGVGGEPWIIYDLLTGVADP